MKILVIYLPLNEARLIETSDCSSLDNLITTLICSEGEDNARLRVFDLMSGRELQEEASVENAGIREGDILIASNENPFPPDDPPNDETIPTTESFDQALAIVRRFDHYGHKPQVIRCRVNDNEFRALIHASTATFKDRDERFGGQKLVADMMVSTDTAYRRERLQSDSGRLHFVERIRHILERSFHRHDRAFAFFEAKMHQSLYYPHIERREPRYLFNAAAMRLERPPFSEASLLDLVRDGVIGVGEITVETTDDVRLSEVVLNDEEPTPAEMEQNDNDDRGRTGDDENDSGDDTDQEQL